MPPLPPADQICFIDANVLYYHTVGYAGVSDYCTLLVRQIMAGQRQAATLSSAVADAVHKVMFGEIAEFHGRPRNGLLAWVKKHPESIQLLTKFIAAAREYTSLPMVWLPVTPGLVSRAAEISALCGLTTNDGLIVAAMREGNISHLVTNDDDFDRVPGIQVWKPR